MTIDELLQKPSWIIDIFPEQVPADSFLEKERFAEIKQKHINIILKLSCYRCLSIEGETPGNLPPEKIAGEMRSRCLFIMADDSMILSEPDDTHMTVFNPDEKLLELIKSIAAGEGLFVWKSSF